MSGAQRVLYYNWVDYLDDERRGGGVSVYQRNLLEEIDAQGETGGGIETGFLCSGLSYDLKGGAARWEQMRHGPDTDRARRWEIVNSGCQSPSHHSFGDSEQLSHPQTEEAFYGFLDATGPWDVLHLNNLEGLPVAVLEGVRARWPKMRIILSLHNYYPFCPQVNLWHQERETCTDFADGQACVTCLPKRYSPRHLRLAGALSYRLKCAGIRPGTRAYEVIFRWSMRAGRQGTRALGWARGQGARVRRIRQRPGDLVAVRRPDGSPFAARRSAMVDAINSHCDRVLCVSDAVRRLAVAHGITDDLAVTSYIGTVEAQAFAQSAPRVVPQAGDGTLSLAYLGYMRRDKGFYFLLQALEAAPPELAARLRLVVAARRADRLTMNRVVDLGAKLAEVDYADGYAHGDLDRLLERVDVGLIPVLWNDNLPQVAIEMHARHIPLLTADLGGAQELGNCAEMVFPAGDIAAFHARLQAILDGKVDFEAYWRGAMSPVSMGAHLDELLGHYAAE